VAGSQIQLLEHGRHDRRLRRGTRRGAPRVTQRHDRLILIDALKTLALTNLRKEVLARHRQKRASRRGAPHATLGLELLDKLTAQQHTRRHATPGTRPRSLTRHD
jgi:hypothetical protein